MSDGWQIRYAVRQADPGDRTASPDAHEVRMFNDERPLRTVGVWESKRIAVEVAATLNQWAGSQIR